MEKRVKSNYDFSNQVKKLAILSVLCLVFLLSTSIVSAADFSSNGTTGKDIQDFINNPNSGSEIILNSGDYLNNIKNLNISRNVTIKGNGQVNLIGSNSDTLFNISAKNVVISNLNISGYKTAVFSKTGDLLVENCNISTTGSSIDLKGSTLTGISIKNNNINSSYSSFYYGVVNVNSDKNSVVEVSIKGNNITATGSGTYTMSIRFNATYCNNTLILENNTIIGKDYSCVYLNVSNSNNTITLINNDISLTGAGRLIQERAFSVDMGYANNTITFANNNLSVTSAYGVYLNGNYAMSNTISFTNNKIRISAPSIERTAVYILSRYDGINTITFKDNNITAASNMAVNFDISYKTNIVTLINNIITQEENVNKPYGLYILAIQSNNTMTITNNSIIGLWRPLGLYILDGNNNNIIVSKNNIKGIGAVGLYLTLAGVNKDIINLVDNNIDAKEYAIYISCPSSSSTVSGLSIFNNTLKGGNGLIFDVNRVALKNINITGNTIIVEYTGITFSNLNNRSDSTAAIIVNYNRILADIGLNFRYVNDTGSSFDYNWWGVNDISDKIIGFETKTHYILYFANLTDLSNVHVGDKVSFALLVLNTTLTNLGVEKLPDFVINGIFNGIEFENGFNNLFTYEFTVLEEGLQHLEATLDNQDGNISFEGFKDEEEETPNTDSQTKNYKYKGSCKSYIPYTDENIDNTDDSLNTNASTKSTGVSIAILLILAILGLFAYRKSH